MNTQEPTNTSVIGCFLRIFWMFAGFAALLLLSISIFEHHLYSIRDIIYWLIILFVIISRYLDIRYFYGQTVECKPATMHHWRRYSAFLLVIFAVVWILLHTLSRLA